MFDARLRGARAEPGGGDAPLTAFEVSQVELELMAHGDGAFYKRHLDTQTGGDARSRRLVSGVYYFNHRPKAFSGGALRLYAIGDDDRFIVIEPVHNSLLVFPSWAPHEVMPVSCPSKAFVDSRFAVNCWLRRKTSSPRPDAGPLQAQVFVLDRHNLADQRAYRRAIAQLFLGFARALPLMERSVRQGRRGGLSGGPTRQPPRSARWLQHPPNRREPNRPAPNHRLPRRRLPSHRLPRLGPRLGSPSLWVKTSKPLHADPPKTRSIAPSLTSARPLKPACMTRTPCSRPHRRR